MRGEVWWDEHPPEHERVLTLVALALLDGSHLATAQMAFADASAYPAAQCAAAYALLEPDGFADRFKACRAVGLARPSSDVHLVGS